MQESRQTCTQSRLRHVLCVSGLQPACDLYVEGAECISPSDTDVCCAQRFFGTAVGKGRQAAKTEIERLKLGELSCEQGVNEVAKMCAPPPPTRASACMPLRA